MCHARHINPIKIHPKGLSKNIKKLANDLGNDGSKFLVWKENFNKIETKNNICINVFVMRIN